MPKRPLLTILIPTLNPDYRIFKVISQYTSFDSSEYQIIIVDDASTNGWLDHVPVNFIDQIEIHVNEARLGVYENFKQSLQRAAGPFFMFQCQDDRRLDGVIHSAVGRLVDSPNAVTASSLAFWQLPEGEKVFQAESALGETKSRITTVVRNLRSAGSYFYGVHRTSVARQFDGWFRPHAAVDWDFVLFMASQGEMHIDQKLGIKLGHNGSSTRPDYLRKHASTVIDLVHPLRQHMSYRKLVASDAGLNRQALAPVSLAQSARFSYFAFRNLAREFLIREKLPDANDVGSSAHHAGSRGRSTRGVGV